MCIKSETQCNVYKLCDDVDVSCNQYSVHCIVL